jgi:hypothetical protein
MSDFGANRERTGPLADWTPASRRVSSGTTDTGESAARTAQGDIGCALLCGKIA